MIGARYRYALLLTLLLPIGLTACDGCKDEPDHMSGGDDDMGLVEFDAGTLDAGQAKALTPDMLSPVFSAVGPQDAVPRYLDVQFAHPVIDGEVPRAASDATDLRFVPEVAGSLEWITISTLRFTPTNGFAPGQQFQVVLDSSESANNSITPSSPWTFSFQTPNFGFVGLQGGFAMPNHNGEVSMLFSDQPNLERLATLAHWTLNGKALDNVKYNIREETNYVSATFASKDFGTTNTVGLTLDDGLTSATGDGSDTAHTAQIQIELLAGESIELFSGIVKEADAGFYVEIACKDSAATGGLRWYWDSVNHESLRVSRRCLPTEEAFKSIRFHPKVNNLRVGSGEAGFNILGDFKRQTYTLTIDSGMQSIDGAVLKEPFHMSVTIPTRTPKLDFVNQGRYLPKSSWDKLAVRHLNTPEIVVEVRHVPEQNVVFWLSQDREDVTSRTASIVARETIDLKGEVDVLTTSFIDLANIIGKPSTGLYEVSIKSGTASDRVRLLMTDMNLIVKRGSTKPNKQWPDEVYAWVIDMNTALPIVGVDVELVFLNGKALATCKTDSSGGCRLEVPPTSLETTPPFAIIARHDGEFTYLKYDDLKVDPGDAEVHGVPYVSPIPYRAVVYSDRGVYRPGETAHFVGVIRNKLHQAPRARVPVSIEIRDSRRRVLGKFVERTNEVGLLTFDQKLEDFAATGAYDVTLSIAKNRVDTYGFNVEEFVPERMEVHAKTTAKDLLATNPASVSVDAKYLFGGSAKDSPVEVSCRVEPSTFTAKTVADYTFGPATKSGRAIDLDRVNRTLDADGKATLACSLFEDGATWMQTGKLVASVAVFEAGSGRYTVAEATATVHPEAFHIGLKTGTSQTSAGKAFDVTGVVVDWDGAPFTKLKQVEVEFIRLEREYWWYYDQSQGEDAWGQNIRPVVEAQRIVKVDTQGRFKLTATPGQDSSGFVVRVKAGATVTDLRLPGSNNYYYWESDESRDMTPRPTRPTIATIEGPDEIEINQPARFKVKLPFDGRLLMTVETDRVITHEWHDAKAGVFDWRFTLGKFAPNVYVSALLIKDPHLDSKEAFMPDRAFGVRSVRVRPTDQLHTLKIEAPATIEPNSKLDVIIDVGTSAEPAYVTVAAVDEGILSLTKFKSPKPSDKLFAKRALGVDTFETVGWALKFSPAGPSSRTGGGFDDDDDENENENGESRPMPIKPVALWSGLVKVGKDGKARVSFDVPRYRGALRIMAVSSSVTRTGSASARVVVRDPLVLQTTLPRFLSAGDDIQMPVFVTNMTGQDGVVSVNLSTSSDIPAAGLVSLNDDKPMVVFTGPSTKNIKLSKNQSGTVVFALKALRQAGIAKFKVEAKLGDVTSYDEGIVPFRPSGPREHRVKRIKLEPGKTSLTGQLEGWVPTSERTTVWVTNNPYAQSFDHLKYVIRYPYGCIEQTTSSTRPLLYVGNFVELAAPDLASEGKISDMVKHGIKRVFSMQTADGGFAYWPGGTSSHAWGTAYATHMLLDARDQGFDVPQARIDRALDWLEETAETLANNNQDRYRYYRWAEPYIHYVLAKSGRGKKARIQKLITKIKAPVVGQNAEDAYLLWAALYIAGDRRYEKQLRAPDVAAVSNIRGSHYAFYSDKRRRGFVLSIFFDLFGADKDGESLANLVGQTLSEHASTYYTTQEITWGITGLGKWVQGSAGSFSTPKLYANNKLRKPTTSAKRRSDRSWAIYRASEHETLEVEVEKADGTVYALISSQGVRTNPKTRYGGEGMTITRKFYSPAGKEIEPDGHALGDLIYAVITVKNTSDAERHNLALTDRFAAGFEVENPRLGRGTLPDWVSADDLWAPEHMNIRDDRIEVFGMLEHGQTVKFVYAVRAVSAGVFQAPGPQIEGMYNPEIWGRAFPVRVTVDGPWDSYLN